MEPREGVHEKLLILDFGSQYTQLIARRVRELGVYCEVKPYNTQIHDYSAWKAVILSGSPCSVHDNKAPTLLLTDFIEKIPVLGICYGAQLLAEQYGGSVLRSKKREYGRAELQNIDTKNTLLASIQQGVEVWMSHGDSIEVLPQGWKILASTDDIPVAAFQVSDRVFGLQFHPEVVHTPCGVDILRNFLLKIAQFRCDWTPKAFIEQTVADLKQKIGADNIILGLSGGVDSSVAAALLHKAVGSQLTCLFIDNGLLRKDEFASVLQSYQNMGLQVRGIDAKQRFFDALKGVTDPELKRKTIGRCFIEAFEDAASHIPNLKWLAQGTIYPDVIESVSLGGPSVTIKSHHNVGGLPERMKFQLVEPLRLLFKDEVRRVGKELNIPEAILGRHPFPGPGLAIRVLGEVTPERVQLLQEADAIYQNILREEDLYDKIWQAGAVLLPVRSVGVMGDERSYESVLALRAVTSTDGMTADWYHIPYQVLARISNEIINNVHGINRVVYDISSKPPATIEWE